MLCSQGVWGLNRQLQFIVISSKVTVLFIGPQQGDPLRDIWGRCCHKWQWLAWELPQERWRPCVGRISELTTCLNDFLPHSSLSTYYRFSFQQNCMGNTQKQQTEGQRWGEEKKNLEVWNSHLSNSSFPVSFSLHNKFNLALVSSSCLAIFVPAFDLFGLVAQLYARDEEHLVSDQQVRASAPIW